MPKGSRREAEGRPKGYQGEANGGQRDAKRMPKGCQREAKGMPKVSQRDAKEGPRAAKGMPKGSHFASIEDQLIENLDNCFIENP